MAVSIKFNIKSIVKYCMGILKLNFIVYYFAYKIFVNKLKLSNSIISKAH